jgi:HlyD family secretion protein
MRPLTCWPRCLAGAALLVLAACRGDRDTLTVAGTIEIRQVQLSSLAAGRLRLLHRDEGDTVRAGDTVAVLDQPGLDELIEQRDAQAGAARLRTSEVVAAAADSTRAANDLARAERLRAADIISLQQYDQIRSAAAAAAARLQAVRAAPRESEAARAAAAGTRAIRDELTLLAPDDGIVLTRYAEPGEAVGVGTPIVSIGLVREPWVRAYVGEPFIARVRVGQEVSVRVDGYADTSFAGRITEIAPRAEFTPRVALTERERADLVFAIRVAIDDARGRLKAGMPVELDIPLLP